MRISPPLALAAGLLAVSCAHRTGRASRTPDWTGTLAVDGSREPASGVDRIMRRQVRNATDLGDGDLEIERLRRQMAADPSNLRARLDLAARYAEMGSWEIALEHYRLAAARFPDDHHAVIHLARALRRRELRDEASTVLEGYLKRHSEAPAETYAWAGILRDERGQLKEGELAHRQALALARPAAYLHNNLGQNLLLQARSAEAVDEFQRALQIEPRNEVARNNLGIALARDPERAAAHLKSVSDPATAHNNLAAVLIEQGRFDEARRELAVALSHRPDSPAALGNLALVAKLDGKPASVDRTARGRHDQQGSGWRKVGKVLEKVFVGSDKAAESGPRRPAGGGE